MPQPDPEHARRVVGEIVARVIADHPQDHHEIWAALLVELLAAGLYSEELSGGMTFAAALNAQLIHLTAHQGGNPWQVTRVMLDQVAVALAGRR